MPPDRAPVLESGRPAGGALALAGVLVFYFSVIGVDPALTVGRAHAPWTDGAEYLDGAVSLVRDGAYRIHVAGEMHPPRYPFGYSLLIATALVLGVEPEAAAHRVNQLAGLTLLALVALPLWRRRRFLASGVALLLLATLPAFVILCRSPMSEVSSTVLVVAGVLLLFRYSRSGGRLAGGLGAVLLTASVCFRTGNLLLSTFIPAAVFARHGLVWKGAMRDAMVLGALGAAGLLPLFVFNLVTFGSVSKTGYAYWIGVWDQLPVFHTDNLARSLPYFWRELTQQESDFTTANLYGAGSYFGPAFVLLAFLAPLGLDRSRRFWSFTAAALMSAAAVPLFYSPDARLLLPLAVLAAPVAAAGTVGLWRRQRTVAGAAALIATAAVAGWPATGDRPETLDLLRPPPRSPSTAHLLTHKLQRLHSAEEKLVLTDLPPPYVHAILPPGPLVAPLLDDHNFRYNPRVFTFGDPERRRMVADALAAGRPVWALTHARDILAIDEDCPPPTGYAWEIVAREGRRGGIARLVAALPPDALSRHSPAR